MSIVWPTRSEIVHASILFIILKLKIVYASLELPPQFNCKNAAKTYSPILLGRSFSYAKGIKFFFIKFSTFPYQWNYHVMEWVSIIFDCFFDEAILEYSYWPMTFKCIVAIWELIRCFLVRNWCLYFFRSKKCLNIYKKVNNNLKRFSVSVDIYWNFDVNILGLPLKTLILY